LAQLAGISGGSSSFQRVNERDSASAWADDSQLPSISSSDALATAHAVSATLNRISNENKTTRCCFEFAILFTPLAQLVGFNFIC
jgi:hypothetical protein